MTTSSIGSSGRTYSTIQAWEDACPANITASGTNEIWKGECYNDSEFSGIVGQILTVGGITTDATHYLWLTTATGQGFKDAAGASNLPLRYDPTKGVACSNAGGYAL